METLGYGVIGLGRIGARHIRAISRLPQGRLVAVADTNAEKAHATAAEQPESCTAYQDHREMLEDEDIDVAVVLVPTHLHRDVSVDAMDAGKHVICEKAMAPSVRECMDMIEARDRNGVKLMIAHSTRFRAPFVVARELIEDGAIGEVIGTDGHFCARATQEDDVPGDFWRFKEGAAGHGYVINFGCHHIDAVRAMTGAEPISVSGHVGNRFSEGVIPEDHYTITALCDNDMTISIAQYGSLERYTMRSAGHAIFGTHGMIEAYWRPGRVILIQPDREPQEVEVPEETGDTDPWVIEHRGFHHSIVEDTVEPVTGEDAMRNIEWAIAGYLSSERRCWVDIPLSEEDCECRGPSLLETLPPAVP